MIGDGSLRYRELFEPLKLDHRGALRRSLTDQPASPRRDSRERVRSTRSTCARPSAVADFHDPRTVVSEWSLRDARRGDVSALLRIENEQFPEPWTRAMLLDEVVNAPHRRYRVATEGRSVVGYLGAMFVLDEAHINSIATTPTYEGRGVATALLDDLFEHLATRAVTKVTLEVAASNRRAQRLYRRYGFAPVGVRRNYYAKSGEDALVMWADVTTSDDRVEDRSVSS
jgi:ribosomal-protein-alanine N-acetyltransferase